MKKALLALGLIACGQSSAAPTPHRASDALRACAAMSAAVPSIEAAVDRLNALPAPVDAACFVASVPRPLALIGTTNITSAQPAVGLGSPRIFLLMSGLVVSVAPEGDGANLLEFGEWVAPTRTLKGEVELPVTKHLTADAPFEHALWMPDSTTCSFCHRGETAVQGERDRFTSIAYKPDADSVVPAATLSALHEDCAKRSDPSARCALLHGLFDFGEVTNGAFSKDVATF